MEPLSSLVSKYSGCSSSVDKEFPRTEWDEIVARILEQLNKKLPNKYIDRNGKEKISRKFTKKGLHFKLIKSIGYDLHRLKRIEGTCKESDNYNWTFNTQLKKK